MGIIIDYFFSCKCSRINTVDENAFEAGLSYQVDRQLTEKDLMERRENFEKAKSKAHALPLNPGCYLMKDEKGNVIYVGKAKSLRKRVSQYFLPNRDRKTQALVEKIRDIDHVITGNDYEALILENNLIKKYNPHYNILRVQRCRQEKTTLSRPFPATSTAVIACRYTKTDKWPTTSAYIR